MYRIDSNGNVANMFSEGNPGLGQPATKVDATFLNAVQEELVDVVLRAGLVLDKPTNNQVSLGVDQMLGGVEPGGRLTLTTALPVTTADVAGAATVYYSPFKHNRIRLYDGTRWLWWSFAEMSQATSDTTKSPAAVANNSNYDVFVWMDAGTMRATRGPAWTSDTARGTGAGTTELERFDGRWVNKIAVTNGPAARRGLYVGTIRSDGSAQINDKLLKRHVWNNHNRVVRPMRATDTTDSWNYTTATWRQANAAAGNQLDYVQGLAEDPVQARVVGLASNTSTAPKAFVGVGVDSTSATSSQLASPAQLCVATAVFTATAEYDGYPGLGRHFLAWVEYSEAGVGTTTFYGDAGSAAGVMQAGIIGRLLG